MSDTYSLEDGLPRWILDEPTEADIAPGGGLEDCDGNTLDGTFEMIDAEGTPDATMVAPVEAMDGVALPDAGEAEADHGDGRFAAMAAEEPDPNDAPVGLDPGGDGWDPGDEEDDANG